MGRRYATFEKIGELYKISYPLERASDFKTEDHGDLPTAVNQLVKSITLYSFYGDRVNIYASLKYHTLFEVILEKYNERIKLKKLDIRLKVSEEAI